MISIGIQDVITALSQVPNFSTSRDTYGNKWLMTNAHLQQFASNVIANYLNEHKIGEEK